MVGVKVSTLLDVLHYLSGGVVCFARALNDTPKIAATLLIGGALSPTIAIGSVATAMVLGGILKAKNIAETMSHKVTTMSPGQGLSANLVTGTLVIFASQLGIPVSTTHVSVGSLFGIGAVTGNAKWKIILSILVAWITTLPIAALLAAVIFWTLQKVL
jgi:PiT family inorganic phosphate transporter